MIRNFFFTFFLNYTRPRRQESPGPRRARHLASPRRSSVHVPHSLPMSAWPPRDVTTLTRGPSSRTSPVFSAARPHRTDSASPPTTSPSSVLPARSPTLPGRPEDLIDFSPNPAIPFRFSTSPGTFQAASRRP
jgi:hypothetical protein